MGLLHGEGLKKVVQLFERRGVNFYHACQLADFKSYVRLGGIPSRSLMERSRVAYTAFQTDGQDRAGGMWSKVFGNLSDFGLNFAQFKWIKGPIPNPYGPILLIASPTILLHASDIAICLRSAGAHGFDREVESLSTAEEVDRLFTYTIDAAPKGYATAYIKFSEQLKHDFSNRIPAGGDSGTLNPEVSCTVDREVLPLEALDRIVVDEYQVDGHRLLDAVTEVARESNLRCQIWPRRYKDRREEILAELAREIAGGTTDLRALTERQGISAATVEWAKRVLGSGLDWQFNRFATYLREGTLSELDVPRT